MEITELRVDNKQDQLYVERFYLVPNGESIDTYEVRKDGSLVKLEAPHGMSWQIRGEVFYRTLTDKESDYIAGKIGLVALVHNNDREDDGV